MRHQGDAPPYRTGLSNGQDVNKADDVITVFRISDYTTSREYAEQKQKEGYIINALLFKRGGE